MDITKKLKMLDKYAAANYYSDRIVSELYFAYSMSGVNDGKYDGLISEAADKLLDAVESNGSIVKDDCLYAEEILSPLKDEAKSYICNCVGHAHIDMNWQWGIEETVSVTLETFRTVLRLMEEFPEFTFAQSQASVYEIVEKYEPSMLEIIKQRIAEGRWEVTATSWVENDKNMPSGESQCRHLLYTKEYLSKLLGIEKDSLQIDFEPDTFGHGVNTPEILSSGGVKYYYICRGCDIRNIFNWKAPSGAQVLVYDEYKWYNAEINSRAFCDYPDYCAKSSHGVMKECLKVYGVGDHGGGPTRRDIARICDYMTWPIFPTIKFGRYIDYFRYLDEIRDEFPTYEGELNFVFNGCYSSQSRCKSANRIAEERIYDAEALTVAAELLVGKKPDSAADFSRAYKNTLFCQFHDIITGSGVIDTREYARGLFQETMSHTSAGGAAAMRLITDNIDTTGLCCDKQTTDNSIAEGAGTGFGTGKGAYGFSTPERGNGKTRILHVFNTTPYQRRELCSVTVWDYEGDIKNIEIKDENGNPCDFELIETNIRYWGHYCARLYVKCEVPPFGYTTLVLTEKDAYPAKCFAYSVIPSQRKDNIGDGDYILENNKIKITFDAITCAIVSIIEKSSGRELIGQKSGVFGLISENTRFRMTSWRVGPTMSYENLNETREVIVTDYKKNRLFSFLSYTIKFGKSSLVVKVTLSEDSLKPEYRIVCDWLEIGEKERTPRLDFRVFPAYKSEKFRHAVPGGTLVRNGFDYDIVSIGREDILPVNGGSFISLLAKDKYGFYGNGNGAAVTLLRSSTDPDPYPELNRHIIDLSIAVCADENDADMTYGCYSHELYSVCGRAGQEGTLPASGSALSVEYEGEHKPYISALKPCENGDGYILRMFTQNSGDVKINIAHNSLKKAFLCDINEKELSVLDVSKGKISVTLPSNGLVNIKIIE